MTLTTDLAFLKAFLEQYQDSDAGIFANLDPMTGLSEAMNRLSTLVEDRVDMAAPLQEILLSLGMS